MKHFIRTRTPALRVTFLPVLLLALVCALLVLMPRQAEAASPDPNTYYAQVKYYDNIQIKYVVQHGVDEYWTTTGDIPIGGFIDGSGTRILDQAYCVDATVAFHNAGETSTAWPNGVTTDTTNPGYVVVSPLAVSPNVRANLPSLYWLAVNGFRGERGAANNLADIRARYAALETQYGTPIDETIAIMATKSAVWNFTDPTLALISTSLTKDPENPTPAEAARYKLMIALMKGLVSDARAEGHALSTVTLDVEFNGKDDAVFTQASGGDWYYGPLTVSVASSNGSGTPEKIYLTASGMYASNFVFVSGPSPTAPALPQEPMYGSTTPAPYVNSRDSFYLKIPAGVANDALVNIGHSTNMDFAYLALHGLARSQDVTYSGTPAIMAWQGSAAASPQGVQDWGHVQAFIGFVNNIQASLYGEGHLFMQGNSDGGVLKVSKAVLGATDASNAGTFALKLEVYDNSISKWVPVPLFPGQNGNITGNSGLSAPSPKGLFSLHDGASVSINNLPFGSYRVSEQTSVDGYSAAYQVNSGSPQTDFVAEAILGMQSPTGTIAFTNTVVPHDAVYTGTITLSKTVRGTILGITRFTFMLERYNSERELWMPVALDPGSTGNITGGSGLSAPNAGGVFSLAAQDAVEITGLSPGRYRLTEVKATGGYAASYSLDSGAEQKGFVVEVPLAEGSLSHAVAFINTADGSVVPATGDVGGRQIALLAGILVAGGIGLLVRRKVLYSQI